MRMPDTGLNSYGIYHIDVEFYDCFSQMQYAITFKDGSRRAFRQLLPSEMLKMMDHRWKERHSNHA